MQCKASSSRFADFDLRGEVSREELISEFALIVLLDEKGHKGSNFGWLLRHHLVHLATVVNYFVFLPTHSYNFLHEIHIHWA